MPREARESFQEQREQVQEVATVLAGILEYGIEEKLWEGGERTRKEPRELVILRHGHLWLCDGKWHWCRHCRRSAGSEQRRRKLQSEPCVPWAERLGFLDKQKGHTLKETDTGTIWCTQCGAHGTRQLIGLSKPCKGRRAITVSGRKALQKLEAGFHPDTGAVVGDSVWVVDPQRIAPRGVG